MRTPILLGLIVGAVGLAILIGAAAVRLTGDIRVMGIGVLVVGVPAAAFAAWHELRAQRRSPRARDRRRREGRGDSGARMAA